MCRIKSGFLVRFSGVPFGSFANGAVCLAFAWLFLCEDEGGGGGVGGANTAKLKP